MPQYGAPWQALLNSNAEPVDTVRNQDFDKLNGVDEQPGDDGPTSFVKGLQSSLLRNSPRGQEMTMEIMKAKLANQMAIQLEESKKQLAQKYPTYQFERTPYGSQVFDPTTGKVTSNEDFPGAKEMFANASKAKTAAETATANTQASPEFQNAALATEQGKPDLQKAQIAGQNALAAMRPQMALLDAARAKAADNRAQGPQMTDAEAEKEAMHSLGISGDPKKDMFVDPDGALRAKLPSLKQQILQQSRSKASAAPTATSTGANQASGSDIGNLLDFNAD